VILAESRSLFNWWRFFSPLRSMKSCIFGQLVAPIHLAAPLLEPSVDGVLGLLLLWRRHFIILPFQLHFFLILSVLSVELWSPFTWLHRFLRLQSTEAPVWFFFGGATSLCFPSSCTDFLGFWLISSFIPTPSFLPQVLLPYVRVSMVTALPY
jgi:hypothetical protein